MNFTPNSIIKLLNCPLQKDNKNQMDFANASAQYNYFNSIVLRAFTNFTYQRKESVIRVPVEADALYNCNYVMYDNANFTNKWIYAFITEIEYVNPNCTALHIKIDVWQTWQFVLTFHKSFIERQHTPSDNIGQFCEPENISVPAFPVSAVGIGSTDNVTPLNQNIILYFSKQPHDISSTAASYNSGALTMQYHKLYQNTGGQTAVQLLQIDLDILERNGELDLIDDVGLGFFGDSEYTQDGAQDYDFISAPFVPFNNKSYMYCYAYLHGTTNFKITIQQIGGRSVNITSESWWGSTPFQFARLNNVPNTVVEYSAFPTANIRTSTFQNSVNHSLKEMNALSKGKFTEALGFGMTTGGIKGAAGAAASSVLSNSFARVSAINEKKDDTLYPDSFSGYRATSAVFQAYLGGIYLIKYAPKTEAFKKIDDYFTMFGYSRNQLLDVSFKNRPYWDFIKTVDIDITGDLPQDDLQEIKNMFDNGVTFWHVPADFGNYNLNNAPI